MTLWAFPSAFVLPRFAWYPPWTKPDFQPMDYVPAAVCVAVLAVLAAGLWLSIMGRAKQWFAAMCIVLSAAFAVWLIFHPLRLISG